MIDFDSVTTPGLSGLDADSQLGDLGPLPLDHPVQDIDGDGVADTVTRSTGSALTVATDADTDGFVDHLTIIDRAGGYASWEFHHTADGGRWERTDGGKLTE